MKIARIAALALLPVLVTPILAGCSSDNNDKNAGTQSAGQASEGADEEVTLSLVAQNTKFDKSTLEAPAGKVVSLTMENKDVAEHTFTLYQSEDATTTKLAGGDKFGGPAFLTYQFTAPETPGKYYFRCDIHPSAMHGDFVVK